MKITNSLKITALSLMMAFTYNVNAKALESVNPALTYKNPLKAQTLKESDVAIQLLTDDETFLDLGLTPQALGRYILEVAKKYEDIFKTEGPNVVAVGVEVSAHEPKKEKDCTDYTQCVMVKFFVKGDEAANENKVIKMQESLMQVKETEITNFKSESKAAFVIYFRKT